MAAPTIGTGSTPPDRFPLEIHACAESAYLVRNLVDHATEAWGLAAMRDTGRLILTELVTNAAKLYTGTRVHAWIARPEPGIPVLEAGVWDLDGATMPRIVPPDDHAESGRGLFLIQQLTGGRLGWFQSRQGGKVVWARWGSTAGEEI